MKLAFEPLDRSHDRSRFTCGDATLDRWFRTQAGQEERRNVTRVFIARDIEAEGSDALIGFYTLSMFALAFEDLPEDLSRRLPRYPEVPAALIGRLGRAERVRGQGMGERLLADAIARVIAAARTVAAFAIVVDAKDAGAVVFYRGFGFIPFPTRPNRLFLLTETARAALK
jgi:ribosomal protein S18 acetylase RimI-like enzyme